MLVWQDKDKRRAFLLSLVLHCAALLLLIWLVALPQPTPPETFLVIDVGTPALSEEQTDAPAADAPAPQATESQVEASDSGEPQASVTPETSPEVAEQAAPEVQETAQVQEPVEEITEVAPELTAPEQTLPEQPEVAEAVTPEAPAQATPAPQETTASVPAPRPEARVPESAPPQTDLPVVTQSTTLPEIEEVELTPRPLAQSVALPQPSPEVEVRPARTITTTPSVQVAAEQAVPSPDVSASVATPQAVPTPEVAASVSAAQAVPTPQVSSSVAQATAVPQPEVAASVAQARAVPTPSAQVSVAESRSVPQPQVQSSVAQSRAVTVTPQASVAPARTLSAPAVSATVTQPTAGSESAATSTPDAPQSSATTQSNRQDNRPEGGNADRAGQTTDQPDASSGNLGLAAGPNGSTTPTGSPLPIARTPYNETRERPLAVIIDNANGYPQAGLREASMIIEMPVEGGLTRLMTIYDNNDPNEVGPVRSARDYFYEFAKNKNSILVHDGGSPSALAAIERSELPTFNAFSHGDLFARKNNQSAPYNLYTQGNTLRSAINRLNLQENKLVKGLIYRPQETAPDNTNITTTYSSVYSSGFAYVQDLNLYRWVRNGERASDVSGEAVYADAVLVARVEVRPIADDPEGRLYIPLRGGEARLFLRGKEIVGRWSPNGGIEFVTSEGVLVDLTPFKTWVLFTPTYADVSAE